MNDGTQSRSGARGPNGRRSATPVRAIALGRTLSDLPRSAFGTIRRALKALPIIEDVMEEVSNLRRLAELYDTPEDCRALVRRAQTIAEEMRDALKIDPGLLPACKSVITAFQGRLAEIYNTLSAISNMPLLQQLINHAAHERELLRFDIDLIAELKAFRERQYKMLAGQEINIFDVGISRALELKEPARTAEINKFLALKGEDAQQVLNALQVWLDRHKHHVHRRDAIYLLYNLSVHSNRVPSSIFLPDVIIASKDSALKTGGFADIFRGTCGGKSVAVKRLRVTDEGQTLPEAHQAFCREALVWRQLRHPNVLHFLGIDDTTFSTAEQQVLCMVSPWMQRGTLMQHVKSSQYDPAKERQKLIEDVALGLEYLHSQKVVHGDLHGSNVFIDQHGAVLADFGLVTVGEHTQGRIGAASQDHKGGVVRWTAPEIMRGDKKSSASDVYAFACICLAVTIRASPFAELRDYVVGLQVLQGERPARPTERQCGGVPLRDALWKLIEDCWHQTSTERPSMQTAVKRLRAGVMVCLSSS